MNGPHAIILACDDAYAYCAAVAIASIIRHTDSDIDFILLDDGISDEKKQDLFSCIHGRPGIRLRFMDISWKLPDLSGRIQIRKILQFLLMRPIGK